MGNYNVEDFQAYIDYCNNMDIKQEDMDLDEIDSSIEKLEEAKGKIDKKIIELQEKRVLRLGNVKMLIKAPQNQDKIAC